MSPFSGHMTTDSFDANAAISPCDLCLIIVPRAPEPAPKSITSDSGGFSFFFKMYPPASGAGGPVTIRTLVFFYSCFGLFV